MSDISGVSLLYCINFMPLLLFVSLRSAQYSGDNRVSPKGHRVFHTAWLPSSQEVSLSCDSDKKRKF